WVLAIMERQLLLVRVSLNLNRLCWSLIAPDEGYEFALGEHLGMELSQYALFWSGRSHQKHVVCFLLGSNRSRPFLAKRQVSRGDCLIDRNLSIGISVTPKV